MINAFVWYFIGQVGCFFLSFQLAFLEVGCSTLLYQVVLKTNVIDGYSHFSSFPMKKSYNNNVKHQKTWDKMQEKKNREEK